MKILLAVDNSPFSRAATDAIAREFNPADTQLHVMSVVDTTKLMPKMDGYGIHAMFVEEVTAIVAEWRKDAESAICQSMSKLWDAGFVAKSLLFEGDPKGWILDHAEDWKPDLIVLGSHGKSGLDRLVLGSVSDAILRHAKCSVRIVRIASRAAEEKKMAQKL